MPTYNELTRAHPDVATVEKLDDVTTEGWFIWNEILVRRTDDDVVIGVQHYIYTWGVLRHVDDFGYAERWCYHTLPEAVVAATLMESTGEPEGFIRKACG